MKKMIVVLGALMMLAASARRTPLTSEVRMVEGKPALFVNGEQKSMILASPYRQGPRDFNTFRAGGIEIFNFYVRFPWTGPDKWDFSGSGPEAGRIQIHRPERALSAAHPADAGGLVRRDVSG